MGMAGRRRKRRSENRLHSQPGQPHLARPLSHLRQRCLGARLLSQIQQPPSRVSAGLVERGQLGRNQQALPSVAQEVTVWRGHSCPRRFLVPSTKEFNRDEPLRFPLCTLVSLVVNELRTLPPSSLP